MTGSPATPEPLGGWLAWLGAAGCTCPHQWKGLGRLYGTSFGNGWVRLETVPSCPVHGTNGRWVREHEKARRDTQGGGW